MLRFFNPAYVQLSVVLIFPIFMIAGQLSANGSAAGQPVHADTAPVAHLALPYQPVRHAVVVPGDDGILSGEL